MCVLERTTQRERERERAKEREGQRERRAAQTGVTKTGKAAPSLFFFFSYRANTMVCVLNKAAPQTKRI